MTGVSVGVGVGVGVAVGGRVPVGVAVGVGVLVDVEVAVAVDVAVWVGVAVAVGGLTIKATCSVLLNSTGLSCIPPQTKPNSSSAPKLICKSGSGFASSLAPHSGQVYRVAAAGRPQTRQRMRPSVMGLLWPHCGQRLQSGLTGAPQLGHV